MSKTKRLIKIYVFLVAMIICAPAQAVEKLLFNQAVSARLTILIEGHTDFKPKISKVDLNEDGMDEFIVKDSSCTDTNNGCLYQVLAETNDNLIELGRIQAKHVMLGNGYNYGIRSLMAFKDANNDYDYDLYVWEPKRSQYILSKEQGGIR